MILAGDVGGTKTLLLLREDGRTIAEERFSSQAYGDLAHMVKEFLDAAGSRPDRAAIGVAGPVNDNKCWATNLPWQIDGDKLAFQLGIGRVRLLNDFATVGYGLESLGPDDVVALNDRQPDPRGPIAILGAGTGLGEGFMIWCGERYVFVPSEGGHGDFAARNDREVGFLRFMQRQHKRVSIERAVSGPGIGNLYRYLVDDGGKPDPAVTAAIAAGEDIAAVVSAHAKAKDCPVSVATMDMFLRLYGAEAGNLALKVLATGGVFLAGGIAAKNIDLIRSGPFMAALGDKGRLSDLVRSIPVRVVVNTRVGLLGAASVADGL